MGRIRLHVALDCSGYSLETFIDDNIETEQLIKMAKYGIDGDYISELRQTGVDISIEDIIQLGKHNVSADYVRSMQSDKN